MIITTVALSNRDTVVWNPSIIIFIGCYRTRNATAEQFTFPLMFRAFLSIASRKDLFGRRRRRRRKGEREAFCVAVALKGKGSPVAKPTKRCRGQSLIIRVYYEPRNQSVACNYVSIPSTYFVTLLDALLVTKKEHPVVFPCNASTWAYLREASRRVSSFLFSTSPLSAFPVSPRIGVESDL